MYRAAPGDAVPALNAATRTPAQGSAGHGESGAQALPMQGRAGHGVAGARHRPGAAYADQVSRRVTLRLNTGVAAVWSRRSATK